MMEENDEFFEWHGNEKDLMYEGSNSRAYSFNLYLEPGIIHYKRNYIAVFTTTKTVVKTFIFIYGKRRCFFIMKWTTPPIILPFLFKRYPARNNVYQR